MRYLFVVFLALGLAASASAQTTALRTFTVWTGVVGCSGADYWINVADYPLGAGTFPTGPSIIRGYQIWSTFRDPGSYVMVGKTPPYGDAITPYIFGTSRTDLIMYQANTGFPFNPTLPATEQLHIHYACSPGDPNPRFGVTIIYSLNSDPLFAP